MNLPWHQLPLTEALEHLRTDTDSGLSLEAAKERLEGFGHNILKEENKVTLLERVIDQIRSPLVYVLIFAGVITLVLGEHIDFLVIAIALIINIVVGVLQEERASKAFDKLKESQEDHAIVIRGGKKQNILSADLVPGDIVLLDAGFHVPADVRLVETKDLKINEAVLTGEWLVVKKEPGEVASDASLAERTNMAFMGTTIAAGSGRGVVVATAKETEVGKIAAELGTIDNSVTPLQENMRKVARFLSYAVLISLVGIFILGVLRGEALSEMLLIAIAVAVATIPSGLPAAVTVVLAMGMEAILKRGGLVRNLLAAETLGSTTIILTDKTGTLTQARMKVTEMYTYESLGLDVGRAIWTTDDKAMLEAAVLVSNAFVEEGDDAPKKLTVHGLPIEKAIVLAGLESGIVKDALLQTHERLDYLQFSSEWRFAAALYKEDKKRLKRVYLNGAPELLLEAATHLYKEGHKIKFTDALKSEFAKKMKARSEDAMRLIGVAYKEVDWEELPEEGDNQDITRDCVFVGFMGFEDPIREDVNEALAEVRGAGARVIMITGDNPITAGAIAKRVGILSETGIVIRGDETEAIDDERLFDMLMNDIQVIARAAPAQKLRIARLLRDRGEVVAMTGDGINDAPALRAASIGVAVGSGTEVAKEASDLVLINNSFSIIVAAIEEGRRLLDNLKKIVAYLLATSFSEIFLIVGALITGSPLPLVPAQILWANIVEEGLMSFSFAFEKKDPGVMKRNPRSLLAKNIMSGRLQALILLVSTISGLLSIAIYYWLLSLDIPMDELRTIMFVNISMDAIFVAFSLKSFDTPVWKINPFSNLYLLAALAISIGLLLLALVWGPLQTLLSLQPLKLWEILVLLGIGVANLFTIEICKYFLFERVIKKEQAAATHA